MPNKKGKLFIYEAIALMDEYLKKLQFLYSIIEGPETAVRRSETYGDSEYHLKPIVEADKIKEEYKKILIKRGKLDIAILEANMRNKIEFEGNIINISEALKLLKNMRWEMESIRQKIYGSAVIKIIHKDERDIKIELNDENFTELFHKYYELEKKIRILDRKIKHINFTRTVNFKDEQ